MKEEHIILVTDTSLEYCAAQYNTLQLKSNIPKSNKVALEKNGGGGEKNVYSRDTFVFRTKRALPASD